MENASKALIMAASVLVAIIVISLLSIFFNNLRNVVRTQEDVDGEVSIAEYNKQYDVYARNVYGTELFSLANKILSYNVEEKYSDNGYGDMHLEITLTEDLNSNHNFFKKKPYGSNQSYYTAEQWVDEFTRFNNEIKHLGNEVFYSGTPKGSNVKIWKRVSELAALRSNERTELGFEDTSTDNKATKGLKPNYTLKEAIDLYVMYKGDLKKVKENAYRYDNVEYYQNGRIKKLIYSR